MPPSDPIYGIDTSIFVRLLTGHPKEDFEATAVALRQLVEKQPTAQIVVSNQVIGEAYIALQFHYQLGKREARQAIHSVLSEGSLAPLNGTAVLDFLLQEGGCGLVDRLIAQDYHQQGATNLTNDRRMAKLPGAKLLQRRR